MKRLAWLCAGGHEVLIARAEALAGLVEEIADWPRGAQLYLDYYQLREALSAEPDKRPPHLVSNAAGLCTKVVRRASGTASVPVVLISESRPVSIEVGVALRATSSKLQAVKVSRRLLAFPTPNANDKE